MSSNSPKLQGVIGWRILPDTLSTFDNIPYIEGESITGSEAAHYSGFCISKHIADSSLLYTPYSKSIKLVWVARVYLTDITFRGSKHKLGNTIHPMQILDCSKLLQDWLEWRDTKPTKSHAQTRKELARRVTRHFNNDIKLRNMADIKLIDSI